MKNIKTMKIFANALFIFGCFIAVVILSVYFLSTDKAEVEQNSAQHIIYQSIGEIGGFSKGDGAVVKSVNILNENIGSPDIEAIVRCYTNSSATVFRDYLKALNVSMGQFCKVQRNLEITSASNQHNSDRCAVPKSIIMNTDELGKLGRKYTGNFAEDLALCKI